MKSTRSLKLKRIGGLIEYWLNTTGGVIFWK